MDHDMEVLFAELGMHVLSLRQPFITGDAKQAYQSLLVEKSALDDLDARILHLRQLGQSLQDASSRISKLKDMIDEHWKSLRVVFGRIGVIAWEEASSGVLSEVVRAILPHIEEMQEKAAALRRTKETVSLKSRESPSVLRLPLKLREMLITRRLDRFAKTHEEFFINTGKDIAEALLIKHLGSGSAVELDTQYHKLTRDIAVWQEEKDMLRQRISKDKSSLEEVGVAGSVERKVMELQGLRKQQSETVTHLAIGYGKLICKMENPWKQVDVTAETLRCYDQIRRHERIRAQLQDRIGDLHLEQQIGELILLVEEDENRIAHLRQLIDQYSRQIEDIQKDIGHHREQIVDLKQTLAKNLEREEL